MRLAAGSKDIVESLYRWRASLYLAKSDTYARYRRSVLGPFWLTLGTVLGVVGLGIVWGSLLKLDYATFIPSLTAGLIVWQLISGCITESPLLFVRQSAIIRNLKSPYFFYVQQLVLRHLVTFLHNFIVFVVVALLLDVPLGFHDLWLIPCLFLLLLNLMWCTLFLSILGARFKDVEHLITAMMPILFFLSPVLFRPNYVPFSSWLIWLNPLTYWIEIVREPLLGSAPTPLVLGVVSATALLGWCITLVCFNAWRNKIPFWV